MEGKTIEFVFGIGEIVYLLTDPDQYERIVVGYEVDGNLGVRYCLRLGEDVPSSHYRFEITTLKGLDITHPN